MGRWVRAAVGVLLLGAAACSDGDGSAGAGSVEDNPSPPLPAGDVVTVASWMDGRGVQAVHPSAPSDSRIISGGDLGVVVLAPDGEDETSPRAVVVSPAFRNPSDGEMPEPTGDIGQFGSIYPGAMCGGRTLVAAANGGPVRVSSHETSDADLSSIGAQAHVDSSGDVTISADLEGWHEVGRLPADWRSPTDGSVGKVEIGTTPRDGVGPETIEVLARRIDEPMAAALRALLCEDPSSSLLTQATFVPYDFDGQEARTLELADGSTARAGVLANTSAVVFAGDRLLEFDNGFGGTADDDVLARLIADVVVVARSEFDAAWSEIDRVTGDEAVAAYAELLPPTAEVVADGLLAGHRWILFEADVDGRRQACLRVVRSVTGRLASAPDLRFAVDCVDVGPPEAPLLQVGYDFPPIDALLGFAIVPASAGTAQVTAFDQAGEATIVGGDRHSRYVVFEPPVEFLGLAAHPPPEGDVVDLVFHENAVATITVLDDNGAVVAEDTIGEPGADEFVAQVCQAIPECREAATGG